MARQLIPLKVKIGISDDGGAKYPDFNQLPVVQSSGLDWSKYVDVYGTGWHYDSVGHKEERIEGDTDFDSPFGQQWGMLIIPETFANEATSTFPDDCETMTEAKAQTFYEEKHGKDFSEEIIDEEALKPFEVKERMGVVLTVEEKVKKAKALDPNDPEPGITKNPKKTWADFKNNVGISIKEIVK